MENTDRELQWDDQIQNEGSEFVLIPSGDYAFTVDSFERGRSKGSDKLPPCNMAIIKLHIDAPEGSVTISHYLILHTKLEWKLSEFFASIGQKKKGEPLTMNWGKVPGSTGRAKVIVEDYTTAEGEKRQSNKIDKFYAMDNTPVFKAGDF